MHINIFINPHFANMSVEETEKTVEIAGDRKLPIQRNATLDTATAEDDDDDMTVGTNNPSSGASARSDGLIAACIGDEEEEEELDITAIAAKRYRQSKQEEKQTRHDSRNGHYQKNADCDSLDSEEAWMRQPIGGPGGENIPASFVSPPKKVASEAPVPHSASTSSSSSPQTIEDIETILHSDDLSVETRSVSSNVDDSNGENMTTPLDFAPRQQSKSKLRQSIHLYAERLFGDQRPNEVGAAIDPEEYSARTWLPNEVFFNEHTKLWVVTLHTDQKSLDRGALATAVQSMQAYSFHTEAKAREAVLAMATPRMKSFDDHPSCFDCGGKFAFFRRACHCRNCGACICKIDCSVKWPRQSIPHTYNTKDENLVNICRSCHHLSSLFRDALLSGDEDKAMKLYETGNINLRSPFAHVKGEVQYPIHCAILGENLNLIKWLVDVKCVPLHKSSKKKKCKVPHDGTLTTSRGKTILELAIASRNIDVVRYLVCDKNISILSYKDLGTALITLEAALKRITLLSGGTGGAGSTEMNGADASSNQIAPVEALADDRGENRASDAEMGGRGRVLSDSIRSEEDTNTCIICCNNPIDCVTIPCGHSLCCLKCSTELTDCPLCCTKSTFLRTFKP